MNALKVGDKVATGFRYRSGTQIVSIIRETPKTFVCAGGLIFKKETLRIVGADSYGPHKVWIPTEQDLMNARIDAAKKAISLFVVTKDSIDAVEALLASVSGVSNGAN